MKLMARFTRSAIALFVVSATALALAQQSTPQSTYAQPAQSHANAAEHPAGSNATPQNLRISDATVSGGQLASVPPADLLIGPGDLLKVSVLGAPDFDQEIRVSGSGDAALALVGPVHVAGLTTEQAQELLRKKLIGGGFFTDPQVSVLEKEYATQGVSVLGEVQKPGIYPIMGPRRLFDVLSLAGGTTPKAGQVVSISHRGQSKDMETVHLSNNPQDNMTANVSVRPGDTVVISKAGVVYVVGDVHTPTGVIMDNGGNLTVLQAIAMAQGANSSAALNKSKIIRKTAEGQVEIPIELKKILGAKKPDVKLQAEDIVFVPNSTAKSVAARSLNAAVGLATTVVAYRTIY
jgi:polysaccharide export outer membrane protein